MGKRCEMVPSVLYQQGLIAPGKVVLREKVPAEDFRKQKTIRQVIDLFKGQPCRPFV